jgi:hypothetical protein
MLLSFNPSLAAQLTTNANRKQNEASGPTTYRPPSEGDLVQHITDVITGGDGVVGARADVAAAAGDAVAAVRDFLSTPTAAECASREYSTSSQ